MDSILNLSLPVLGVTLVPVLAGRLTRMKLRGRARLLAPAAIVLLSVALGVCVYVGRAAGVPVSQALLGAAVATLLIGLVPLFLFYGIGYVVRSRVGAAVCWVVSSLPVLTYGLIVAFMVAGTVSCPPGAYECL
jgi:hypothetical protein